MAPQQSIFENSSNRDICFFDGNRNGQFIISDRASYKIDVYPSACRRCYYIIDLKDKYNKAIDKAWYAEDLCFIEKIIVTIDGAGELMYAEHAGRTWLEKSRDKFEAFLQNCSRKLRLRS